MTAVASRWIARHGIGWRELAGVAGIVTAAP